MILWAGLMGWSSSKLFNMTVKGVWWRQASQELLTLNSFLFLFSLPFSTNYRAQKLNTGCLISSVSGILCAHLRITLQRIKRCKCSSYLREIKLNTVCICQVLERPLEELLQHSSICQNLWLCTDDALLWTVKILVQLHTREKFWLLLKTVSFVHWSWDFILTFSLFWQVYPWMSTIHLERLSKTSLGSWTKNRTVTETFEFQRRFLRPSRLQWNRTVVLSLFFYVAWCNAFKIHFSLTHAPCICQSNFLSH